MVATVVGTRYINFEDKEGKRIAGTKIFCVLEMSAEVDGVVGQMTDDVFVRDGSIRLPEFVPGKKYDFEFQQNGFGKKPALVNIVEVSAKAS